METIDIVELFERCINGKGGCDTCPHREGKSEDSSTCITRLGRDVINHIKTLKEQIEYYEEVIEEYETAELERQEHVVKPLDTPWATVDSSTTWTMTLDDCTAITGTGSIPAERLASTASDDYTSTRVSSTWSIRYDPSTVTTSSSSKWEAAAAVEKTIESVETELKKKAKKPRWFEAWTEKT